MYDKKLIIYNFYPKHNIFKSIIQHDSCIVYCETNFSIHLNYVTLIDLAE